ncbi:hypothetical protein PINS_up003148 [Pythium insidiosum]|nr:hypothetical protein PINS_up003148 [Pythium insidiosum]
MASCDATGSHQRTTGSASCRHRTPSSNIAFHIRDPRSLLVLIDCTEPLPSPTQVPILKPGRTDTDLEEQVEKFCERNIEVNEETQEIVLPRVFRTFRDDFGASEAEMLSWLSQYMESAPATWSRTVLDIEAVCRHEKSCTVDSVCEPQRIGFTWNG